MAQLNDATPDTLITADAWWNPMTDQVNSNTSGLAATNSQLDGTVADGGISDLDSRLTSVEGTSSTNGSGIASLNDAVGMPYSDGESLSSRLDSIEAGNSSWKITGMRLRRTTDQSIPASTDTYITWDTIDHQSSGFTVDQAMQVVTVPSDGMYQLEAGYRSYASGAKSLAISKGSEDTANGIWGENGTGGPDPSMSVLVTLTAGSQLAGVAWLATAGSITNDVGRSIYMNVWRLGGLS